MMNEFWGKVHFWPSLICMNMIFLPDVSAGNARHASPLVRWRPGLESGRRKGLGPERFRMEHADFVGGLDHGPGADSVHHQFLLEHQARQESERQSVGGDHARMAGAFAAAARKFHRRRRWPIAGRTNTACPGADKDFTMQNEPVERSRAQPAPAPSHEPVLA